MKNLKPLQLILIGSFGVLALTLVFLLFLFFIGIDIQFETLILLPLFSGGVAFVIFFVLIKQFINERLRLVYRSIRRGKITKENELTFKFREDVISNAEKETKKWTEERQDEIEKLKEQEEFRREFLGNLAH